MKLWIGQVLKLKTILVKGIKCDIYSIDDFPYKKLKNINTVGDKYIDVICTLDIESTSFSVDECDIIGTHFGFMYIWGICIKGIVVMGRTWGEFLIFLNNLSLYLNIASSRKLVIWVHFLSFEFQFFRNFFNNIKVFAIDKRIILYAIIGNIEFRCSYKLTNMSLDAFTRTTPGVVFTKMDGKKFDYRKKRYPDTVLSNDELAYLYCDIVGLYEALFVKLKEYNLTEIPYTSTGYVRRIFRNVMSVNKKNKQNLLKTKLNSTTYTLMKEASRGAISGSNHLYTNMVLYGIDSYDIVSSYPYQMITKYFPISKFIKYNCSYGSNTFSEILNKCCAIIVFDCRKIRLKEYSSIPYISKAKCRAVEKAVCGNGKVYKAERLGMCCTEIDFKIISNTYTMEDVRILDIYVSERGFLADEFRAELMNMFLHKCNLDKKKERFMYEKYKNLFNSAFGMMLTDILNDEIIFKNNSNTPWTNRKIVDINEINYLLDKHYNSKNSFLSYQHGIWVLAHGRDSLMEGMNIVKTDIVQCDTDSVKFMGNYKKQFDNLNKLIISKNKEMDIAPYVTDKNGIIHHLGIWEHETTCDNDELPTYKQFKTLGAKKYCVKTQENEIVPTVSGLSKNTGDFIKSKGGLKFFKPGSKFPKGVSGRTSGYYCDLEQVIEVNINGHDVTMGSSVSINECEYTLGISDEWLDLILKSKNIRECDLNCNGGFMENYLDS